jgi:hypothetical protein
MEREETNPGENFFYFIAGDSDADDEDSQHDARQADGVESDFASGSKRNEGLIGCEKEDCGCVDCEYKGAVLDERAGQ